jgi:hypothetical protein
MGFTTQKMGLHIWNLQTDPYDHQQLADNFMRVEYHDHSAGRGVQIPTEGLADGAVTPVKLSAGLDVGPAFTTYKVLWRVAGYLGTTPSTVVLTTSMTSAPTVPTSAGGVVIYTDPSDYLVATSTFAYASLSVRQV